MRPSCLESGLVKAVADPYTWPACLQADRNPSCWALDSHNQHCCVSYCHAGSSDCPTDTANQSLPVQLFNLIQCIRSASPCRLFCLVVDVLAASTEPCLGESSDLYVPGPLGKDVGAMNDHAVLSMTNCTACRAALQVHKLQQLWRNTAAVRAHQRQLLFMQLHRFAERHAAKLVRTGAAFLSGASLSATSASATRKGTAACPLVDPRKLKKKQTRKVYAVRRHDGSLCTQKQPEKRMNICRTVTCQR